MSAEIIAIVISAVGTVATTLVAMFAGFAWCIRRSDRVEETLGARIDGVRADLGARIDAVRADLGSRSDGLERSLGARIDGVRADLAEAERSLGARIDAVAADTTELKIAIARLEGPQRQLIVAGR